MKQVEKINEKQAMDRIANKLKIAAKQGGSIKL
jgi:hypothetical protein